MDVVRELKEYDCEVDVYDPWVSADEAQYKYEVNIIEKPQKGIYDSIIIAVAHAHFVNMEPIEIHALGKKQHIVYDLKYVLPAEAVDIRL